MKSSRFQRITRACWTMLCGVCAGWSAAQSAPATRAKIDETAVPPASAPAHRTATFAVG
jgi:hypothetical protein